MLGKRIAEPRQYISLYDPALYEAKPADAARYRLSRDVADLGEWKAWPTAPTVFTVRPLEAGFGHLADDMGFLARRQLFVLFVSAVENMSPAPTWETHNGTRAMTDESLAMFGDEVIDEVATFVVESARSDTTPFSSPAGYREFAVNAATARALASVRTRASASASDSD